MEKKPECFAHDSKGNRYEVKYMYDAWKSEDVDHIFIEPYGWVTMDDLYEYDQELAENMWIDEDIHDFLGSALCSYEGAGR